MSEVAINRIELSHLEPSNKSAPVASVPLTDTLIVVESPVFKVERTGVSTEHFSRKKAPIS